jgi:hypothetical protein
MDHTQIVDNCVDNKTYHNPLARVQKETKEKDKDK